MGHSKAEPVAALACTGAPGSKMRNSWMDQNSPEADPVWVMRMNLPLAAGKNISVTTPLPSPVATGASQVRPSLESWTL